MNMHYSSIVLILTSLTPVVWGHGYMIDPASRNACWRVFPSNDCAANYDDNGLNCGGRHVQISLDGKCGVCGDRYGENIHAHPGKYAKGFITKVYNQGQEIVIHIIITANHQGWFEFRVGNINTPPITQEKLTYLLKSPQNQTRHPLGGVLPSNEYVTLLLPPGLTCDHCVLQWWWKVGNSWGCDDEGCGLGHGDQETFVNCADIKIIGDGKVNLNITTTTGTTRAPVPTTTDTPPEPVTTQSPPQTPTSTQSPPQPPTITQSPSQPSTRTQSPPQPTTSQGGCMATGAWAGQPSVDQWCVINCAAGYCPSHICSCS